MTAFCTVSCQSVVASIICIALWLQAIFPEKFFPFETASMRKKDWTMIVLIITVLLLILIVYFIFEKRIEALPQKIN
jgi:uncharacterized membrane protein